MNRLALIVIPLSLSLCVGCGKSPRDSASGGSAASALQLEPEGPPERATARINAEVALATALGSAKAENKRVLVHLGAPW